MTTFETYQSAKGQSRLFARGDRSALGLWWWTTDRFVLGAVLALMGLGVMLSFAASPGAAARLHNPHLFYFAVR